MINPDGFRTYYSQWAHWSIVIVTQFGVLNSQKTKKKKNNAHIDNNLDQILAQEFVY